MRAPRRRLLGCCVAMALSVALGACGAARHPFDATAENNGYYVKLGAVSYQLQVSRELNPYAVEDHQYLTGLPAGITRPTAAQIWYGVFLQARNLSKQPQQSADEFTILDTAGNLYHPIALDSSANQYAWTPQTLPSDATQPGPDTTASFGPTQGALVLFKLPTTVYANRPLTLLIRAPGNKRVSTISLDL